MPVTGGGSSGGGGSLALLSTTTLSGTGNFDVSAISGAYNDLVFILIARGTTAATSDSPALKLNADAGANYYREYGLVSSTSAASFVISESLGGASISMGAFPSGNSPASVFGVYECVIFGYASTTWKKQLRWQSFLADDITTGNLLVYDGGALWNSTAAVTRLQITGGGSGLATGSTLRIYGRL